MRRHCNLTYALTIVFITFAINVLQLETQVLAKILNHMGANDLDANSGLDGNKDVGASDANGANVDDNSDGQDQHGRHVHDD